MVTSKKIIKLARKGETLKTSQLSKIFGISRQTVASHLKKLVEKGVLIKTGSTHDASYQWNKGRQSPSQKHHTIRLIKKTKGLEEDRVFQEMDRKLRLKERLFQNVFTIAAYSVTEMLNNAIEHSKSGHVVIHAKIDSNNFQFEIRDFGIGIFWNVMSKYPLKDEFEALEHVFKGKQTTDPSRHSGEGIFFTSRVSDRFVLRSHQLRAVIDNSVEDTFVREMRFLKGTDVSFCINRRSKKNLRDIFKKYTNQRLEFDRNLIRVKLSQEGGLLARSQARRLLTGLDKFTTIVFDFSGVEEIGQGFADEVFRVFAKSHPEVKLDYVHAKPAVAFMIGRVRK